MTLGFFQLFNPSASWLLLVEMNTDDNPEASLEDSIWSYPGFSRPYLFFSSFFAMPGMEPRALHMPGKLSTAELLSPSSSASPYRYLNPGFDTFCVKSGASEKQTEPFPGSQTLLPG